MNAKPEWHSGLPQTHTEYSAVGFPVTPAAPSNDEVDLRQYYYLLKRHIRGLVLFATAVMIVVAVVVFKMKPVYQSMATLVVDGLAPKVLSIDEVFNVDSTKDEYFQTQVDILKSRDLIKKVIRRLDLGANPAFIEKPTQWPEWVRKAMAALVWRPGERTEVPTQDGLEERLTDHFLKHLSVSPRMKTRLVDLSYESGNPLLSKQVVDALGQGLIDTDLEGRSEITRSAAVWLEQRLSTLKSKLATSEKNLQDFLESENLIDLQGVLTLASKEIDIRNSRAADAHNLRVQYESLFRKIEKLGDKLYNRVEIIPEVFDDPVIRDLKQKEAEASRKLSELTKRYGPDHPSMVAVRSEAASVQSLLKQQITSVASGIKNRYEVARTNEQAALANVEQVKTQVQNIGRKQTRLNELRREIESNRHLYELFFNRAKEASEAAGIRTATTRFVDHGSQSTTPVKPKKALLIGLAFVGSLVLGAVGLLFSYIVGLIDCNVTDARDAEEKLNAPVLGTLPKFAPKRQNGPVNPLGGSARNERFATEVKSIRTHLLLTHPAAQAKVWLIASAESGEGKTLTTLSLGAAFGQLEGERVLLIDADLRNPELGAKLALRRNAPGLGELLSGRADLDACLHTSDDPRLDLLPAGHCLQDPLELLSTTAFSETLAVLRERYSTILIDSPPAIPFSDAYLIAQRVGSVILVVRSDFCAVPTIKEVIKRLAYSHARLTGIIVNDSNASARPNYYENNSRYKSRPALESAL